MQLSQLHRLLRRKLLPLLSCIILGYLFYSVHPIIDGKDLDSTFIHHPPVKSLQTSLHLHSNTTDTARPSEAKKTKEKRYEFESSHMGTLFRIVLYAPGDSLAKIASDAAFNRIEDLNSIMSDYHPESELNALSLSSGSGQAVRVSPSLFEVLQYSLVLSRKSEGAFDVTVGPYVELWRELNRNPSPELPSKEKLDEAGQRVGYRLMKLDGNNHSVNLLKPGMQLDLGGIAKGYAVDEALDVLRDYGISSALVDGGGDIRVGKAPPNKEGWSLVIPSEDSNGSFRYTELMISNLAVATSGDLFQFVEIDGVKYSHIIHPQTGLGLTQRRSVTVIASDGMTADSYASAISVLGFENGADLVQDIPDMEARIKYEHNGSIETWESDGFRKFVKESNG